MNLAEPSEYEIKILRELNGEGDQGLRWGAAMGAAIEFLADDGLVTRGGDIKITQRGKDYLCSLKS